MYPVFSYVCSDLATWFCEHPGRLPDNWILSWLEESLKYDDRVEPAVRPAISRACDLAFGGDVRPLRRLVEAYAVASACPSDTDASTAAQFELARRVDGIAASIAAVPLGRGFREWASQARWEDMWPSYWWAEYGELAAAHWDDRRDGMFEIIEKFLAPLPAIDAATCFGPLLLPVIQVWDEDRDNPLMGAERAAIVDNLLNGLAYIGTAPFEHVLRSLKTRLPAIDWDTIRAVVVANRSDGHRHD
jgi:hypothetical protein